MLKERTECLQEAGTVLIQVNTHSIATCIYCAVYRNLVVPCKSLLGQVTIVLLS